MPESATPRQVIAWLVAVGRRSMASRDTETLDGTAVAVVLDTAGVRYVEEAAEAIRQLTESE